MLLSLSVCAEEIETKIIADKISIKRGEILYAEGNVQIQHGDRRVKAEALQFNQKSSKITFINMQEFYDGKSSR